MKALSLWQPWASAIACGAKSIETRLWATSYRGPIAIHAAKKWDNELRETSLFLARQFDGTLGKLLLKIGIKTLEDMPLGAVIATAQLVACTPTVQLLSSGRITSVEESLGDYSPGRFGWELTSIVPLAKPVPARGFQQLWEWKR